MNNKPAARRRRVSERCSLLLLAAMGTLLGVSGVVVARSAEPQPPKPGTELPRLQVVRGAEQGALVYPTRFQGDVRSLPLPRAWQPGDPIREIPKGRPGAADEVSGQPLEGRPNLVDPLVDAQHAASSVRFPGRAFDTPLLNFEGQGFSGVNPPDTVGDVGLAHYIQAINGNAGTRVRIYDKDTGIEVASFLLQSLGSGQCANGLGDPIVLFDRLANRWLLSEFSNAGNRMCVYISQSSDPVSGGWYAYNFQAPGFPDYPKYAVWPNAYYVGTNEGTLGLYALDRQKMLAGEAATFVRASTSKLSGFGFQMLQPADLDGSTPPPLGAPGIFIRHRDTEVHGPTGMPGADLLELFFLQPDFVNPANTTLTGPVLVPIAEIDSHLCGLTSFQCFPQPGGPTLDPLREVVMWRLQYRNMGTHEALIGNLVTDVNGADRGGIRWFELRRSGGLSGDWELFQEGTYSLGSDNLNRFMGSIAMDHAGNIALGFGANSTTSHTSVRYTGRLEADPPGVMTEAEIVLAQGTANNASNRWGDYSSLNIDPVDDCTFWYTHEYNPTSSNWSTRIGKFTFDECLFDFKVTATPANMRMCMLTDPDPEFTIDVASTGGWTGQVQLSVSGLPPSVTADLSVDDESVDFSSVLSLSGLSDSVAGNYAITVLGVGDDADATSRATQIGLWFDLTQPAVPALLSPGDGAGNVALRPTLSWNAAAAAHAYELEVATDAGFSDIVYTTTVNGTSYTLSSALEPGVQYFWRVRAANQCGNSADSVVHSFTTEVVYCAFPNVAIPDNSIAGVDSSIVVASGRQLADLDVAFEARHTWTNDLVVTLTHQGSGITRTLLNRPTTSGGGGCNGDDPNIIFDDEAGSAANNSCSNGGPAYPVGGRFRPVQTLSAFDGVGFAGTWILNVSDRVSQDTGTLDRWCLEPTFAFAAVDDVYEVDRDTVLMVPAPGVLGNDVGTDLSVSDLIVDAVHGTLSLDADGGFTYTPAAEYCGLDGFVYEMTDGDDSDQATVVIDVICTNEAPTIDDQQFSVDENSANGTVVGTVVATDPDVGDSLGFAITGGSGASAFAIGASSGVLTVADSNQLDFETTPSFALQVTVTDTDGLSDTATITIDLNDVNESPVIDDQQFSIDENSADGTVVGTVVAADPDAGDSLSFAITGGSGATAFAIDASTGVLSVADGSQLDFETTPSFTLQISVTDTGGLSDTATITVDLNDVNEAPVATSLGDRTARIDVPFSYDTSVAFSDVDGDTLTFGASGLPASLSIDPATGVISGVPVAGDIGTHTVLVSASDGEFSAEAEFELTIEAFDPVVFRNGFEASN